MTQKSTDRGALLTVPLSVAFRAHDAEESRRGTPDSSGSGPLVHKVVSRLHADLARSPLPGPQAAFASRDSAGRDSSAQAAVPVTSRVAAVTPAARSAAGCSRKAHRD